MLRAHHPSSMRHYESCWMRFQDYLRRHLADSISSGTILNFLAWLADFTKGAPAIILAHHSALANLIRFGYGIQVPE